MGWVKTAVYTKWYKQKVLTSFLFGLLENYFDVTAGQQPVHPFADFIKRSSHLLISKHVGGRVDGFEEQQDNQTKQNSA